MKISSRRERVLTLPEHYIAMFESVLGEYSDIDPTKTHGEILNILKSIDLRTVSYDEILKLIRENWITHTCDKCNKETEILIFVQDESDEYSLAMCRDCLMEAIHIIDMSNLGGV